MSIATIVPENAVIGQAVNIRSMETDIVSGTVANSRW